MDALKIVIILAVSFIFFLMAIAEPLSSILQLKSRDRTDSDATE